MPRHGYWLPNRQQRLEQLLAENKGPKEITTTLSKEFEPISLIALKSKLHRLRNQEETEITVFDERLLALLKKNRESRTTVEELADHLECPPKAIRESIIRLNQNNYLTNIENNVVELETEAPTGGKSTIDVSHYYGDTIRFAAIGDTHMGSKYERLDVLNALYDIFAKEGIKTVYHTGNFIEGEAKFNRNDIKVFGFGNQVRYFVDNYPHREGMETHFVAGDDHEGWYVQREGIDVGQAAEDAARRAGRHDLHYLSYMEHDIELASPKGKSILRIVHPGGGSSYAVSYTTQKLVESYTGGEKPAILLLGHYHKAEYIYYRNVHCVQTGCVQDQSPFMRKKRLSAHVGGWIIEANQAPDGSINRFKTEFINFFDLGFYKKWGYLMDV